MICVLDSCVHKHLFLLSSSVGEEIATVRSDEPVVRRLGVRFVCDLDVVLVLGACSVSSHEGSVVSHSLADHGHGVFLSVVLILSHLKAVCGLLEDLRVHAHDVVMFFMVEAAFSHGHEHCSVLRGSDSFAILRLSIHLHSTSTLNG